jgi:predicted nucleotidyltransferase
MNLSRPYAAVCPTLDIDVLSALANTTRPLTGREVARLVGRESHEGVREALNRLTEHGLVDRQEAGRALLFTLNRDHLAAPAVAILADMRSELIRRLRRLIESWDIAPIYASMFGSAARADGNTESDIDLFIVRPNDVDDNDMIWRQQLDDLADSVRHWTGNHAGIAEVAELEIPRLRADEPPVVRDLRDESVLLAGPDISTLFGPGS